MSLIHISCRIAGRKNPSYIHKTTNTDSSKHFQNALVMTTTLCAKLFSEYMLGFNCKDDSLERAKKDVQCKFDIMRIYEIY
jgi:hypothetical protein